jgi:hypothetical protein
MRLVGKTGPHDTKVMQRHPVLRGGRQIGKPIVHPVKVLQRGARSLIDIPEVVAVLYTAL